jgi:hypothetical protein
MIMKLSLLLLALLVCVAGCKPGMTMEESQAAWKAEREAEERFLYSGWIKAHGVTNLTLGEWRALKEKNLLPGQPTPKEGMSAGEAAFLGGMIGSSMGRK